MELVGAEEGFEPPTPSGLYIEDADLSFGSALCHRVLNQTDDDGEDGTAYATADQLAHD